MKIDSACLSALTVRQIDSARLSARLSEPQVKKFEALLRFSCCFVLWFCVGVIPLCVIGALCWPLLANILPMSLGLRILCWTFGLPMVVVACYWRIKQKLAQLALLNLFKVDTKNATCGSEADTLMITAKLQASATLVPVTHTQYSGKCCRKVAVSRLLIHGFSTCERILKVIEKNALQK